MTNEEYEKIVEVKKAISSCDYFIHILDRYTDISEHSYYSEHNFALYGFINKIKEAFPDIKQMLINRKNILTTEFEKL